MGDPQLFERVALTGPESRAAYSENWLRDLLYHHPEFLPVQGIDASFSDLVPMCREMPTRAGPVDVVFVTTRRAPGDRGSEALA